MRSRYAPATATSGRPATGPMARMTTIGFREPGSGLLPWASFGLPDTGAGAVGSTPGTGDIGVPMWAFTAALTMDSATAVWVSGVGNGVAEHFSTIAP